MNHLQKLYESCVLVNDNLREEFASSLESPTTFNERLRVTSVSFFIPDFEN